MLHQLAFVCRFVVYFISRIQLLRTNGLEPIVVFDGGRLPIKGDEEESRRRWVACIVLASAPLRQGLTTAAACAGSTGSATKLSQPATAGGPAL
jgi:hypothetical protein